MTFTDAAQWICIWLLIIASIFHSRAIIRITRGPRGRR